MRAIFLSRPTEADRAILVVGEGLIGSAVTRRLRRRPHSNEAHVQTDWKSPSFAKDTSDLLAEGQATSVEIVWAAGVFGMSSSLEVQNVALSFRENLSAVIESAQRVGPVRVHLVSSAGALGCPSGDCRFEALESPYKSIKAAEEEVVARLDLPVRIHRVTSVFGAPGRSSRVGLVGAVLANALRSRETQLYARTTTMRNYIYADDVGEAIARATLSPSTETTLLATIRSHPMNEVVAVASQVLRRPVPVSYRPPRNHHDMIFNPRMVSDLVPQRSLAAGMRLVNDALVSS